MKFRSLFKRLVDFTQPGVVNIQQTKVFGVNVVDTVLNRISYKRSFKGYLILGNAIEK